MAKTTSFALGDYFNTFIEEQVKEGRYASASEVIREALRLLEDQEKQRRVLRDALEEGRRSGDAGPFDLNKFLTEMHERWDGKASS